MRSIALAALAACSPLVGHAQQLTATELSLGAAAVMAHRTFAGAGIGLAHRPSADSRIALDLAGGAIDGRAGTAARAQLTLQLLVNSAARTGWGMYAGMGGVFVAQSRSPGQGFLSVLLGFERTPGGRQGWYGELGLAGGVRAAVGWRARWFPGWWRGR